MKPLPPKRRLLATNNFVNMLGVILAAVALDVLHTKLHWTAGQIFFASGVFCVAVAVYIFWTHLLASTVRFAFKTFVHLCFNIKVSGAIPSKGAALLVANHVSYADALLISATTGRVVRWVMWRAIFDKAPDSSS